MKTNTRAPSVPQTYTHEGAPTRQLSSEEQLRRTVMTCMLGEDVHYEHGVTAIDRIKTLVPLCRPKFVAACAFEARNKMHMRHAPLLLVREMARYPEHKKLVRKLLPDVIQRADELAEFMAIYMKDGKQFLSNPVRRGLADAFTKFNEFQLAKYKSERSMFSLRDVMFLVHPRRTAEDPPKTTIGKNRKYDNGSGHVIRHVGGVLDRLSANLLETPKTWETELSAGADKRTTFETLMAERKLGGLAFIRNLRNMNDSHVPYQMVKEYAETVNLDRVLPFRFVAAAEACPAWANLCDMMLLRSCKQLPKFEGSTIIVVDCSGSMNARLNSRSDMNRIQAAGALAAILRERCDEVAIYATAGDSRHKTILMPSNLRGLALVQAFNSQETYRQIGGGGIFMRQAVDFIATREAKATRVVVITDEQDCDSNKTDAACLGKFNYVLNVAQYNVGISYKKGWNHIHGWSDRVLEYISYDESVHSKD